MRNESYSGDPTRTPAIDTGGLATLLPGKDLLPVDRQGFANHVYRDAFQRLTLPDAGAPGKGATAGHVRLCRRPGRRRRFQRCDAEASAARLTPVYSRARSSATSNARTSGPKGRRAGSRSRLGSLRLDGDDDGRLGEAPRVRSAGVRWRASAVVTSDEVRSCVGCRGQKRRSWRPSQVRVGRSSIRVLARRDLWVRLPEGVAEALVARTGKVMLPRELTSDKLDGSFDLRPT